MKCNFSDTNGKLEVMIFRQIPTSLIIIGFFPIYTYVIYVIVDMFILKKYGKQFIDLRYVHCDWNTQCCIHVYEISIRYTMTYMDNNNALRTMKFSLNVVQFTACKTNK